MNLLKHFSLITSVIVATLFAMPSEARSQIDGFNSLDGWTLQRTDTDTLPAVGQDFVDITSGFGQRRNIWFNTPQSIDQFSASFTYSTTNGLSSQGISFIIHDDSRGLDTVTTDTSTRGFGGIDRSLGVIFDTNSFRVAEDGEIGSGSFDLDLINSFSGYNVNIDYLGGNLLSVSVNDGTNTASEDIFIGQTIADAIGSGDAFIGFGAHTGTNTSTQTISNFRFNSVAVPEPSTAIVLAAVGIIGLVRRRR